MPSDREKTAAEKVTAGFERNTGSGWIEKAKKALAEKMAGLDQPKAAPKAFPSPNPKKY